MIDLMTLVRALECCTSIEPDPEIDPTCSLRGDCLNCPMPHRDKEWEKNGYAACPEFAGAEAAVPLALVRAAIEELKKAIESHA